MKEKCSTRIKRAMNMRGIKQVELSDKSGIKKSALSQYIAGRILPKQDKLTALGLALNVSEVWLMGYDVPMEREPMPNKENDIILEYNLDEYELAEYNRIMEMNLLMFNNKKISENDKEKLEKTLKEIFVKSLLKKREEENK